MVAVYRVCGAAWPCCCVQPTLGSYSRSLPFTLTRLRSTSSPAKSFSIHLHWHSHYELQYNVARVACRMSTSGRCSCAVHSCTVAAATPAHFCLLEILVAICICAHVNFLANETLEALPCLGQQATSPSAGHALWDCVCGGLYCGFHSKIGGSCLTATMSATEGSQAALHMHRAITDLLLGNSRARQVLALHGFSMKANGVSSSAIRETAITSPLHGECARYVCRPASITNASSCSFLHRPHVLR